MLDNKNGNDTRLGEARVLSEEILMDIELDRVEFTQILMKVKRLARLTRDTSAQQWIDYELSGYPSNFDSRSLESCEKYFTSSNRVLPNKKYYPQSFTEMLSNYESEVAILNNLKFPSNVSPSLSSSNEYEHVGVNLRNIVNGLIDTFQKMISQHTTSKTFYFKIITSIKSSVHNYVSDVNIALTFGDIISDEFECVRIIVDRFIQSTCPKSVEQLLSIFERAREGTSESFSQALVSCRRILMSVADSIFPPQDEPYVDTKGRERKVGQEEYKNRLLAFLDKSMHSNGSMEVIETQIEHLAARLDAVYDKACKGTHAEVSDSETRLAIIHTYLFLAEIAKLQC